MAQKPKTGLPVPRRRKPVYSQGTGQQPATPPRQQTIKVNTKQGPIILEALTWGPLAVHKSQGRPGWTVTHIPSGFALKPELTQDAAVQLVTAIRERGLDMNWKHLADCPRDVRLALTDLVGCTNPPRLSVSINIEVK